MEGIPPEKREAKLIELAFKYPTWFFELLVEFDGKPLVLDQFQVDYLIDPSVFKITNKTRQAGGSMVLSLAKFYKAYTNTNYRCDIVSINLKEATDKIKYIRNFWETLPIQYREPLAVDNALSIAFHKGSRRSFVNSLAASAGIRGGRKEVVFDEFAHIEKAEELFKAALPAIMNGDLGLDIVSTPRGKHNFFGTIWLNEPNAKGKHPFDNFSRHKFIWLDVRRFVKDGKFEEAQRVWREEYHENMSKMEEMVEEYGNEKIQQIRDMYPWDYFLQEFCGYFVDDTHAIFSWELIDKCIKGSVGEVEGYTEDFVERWEKRPEGNTSRLILGVDFGKSGESNDKTSIQILEKSKDGKLRHRFSKNLTRREFKDFPSQAEEVARIASHFEVNQIIGDNTGFGSAIMPLIKRMIPTIPMEFVDFNNEIKEHMVMDLKVLMEQNKLWLLADELELHAEIHNIEGTPTPTGRIRYHGEPHDDMFWALCLAAKEGTYGHFAMYTLESLMEQYA